MDQASKCVWIWSVVYDGVTKMVQNYHKAEKSVLTCGTQWGSNWVEQIWSPAPPILHPLTNYISLTLFSIFDNLDQSKLYLSSFPDVIWVLSHHIMEDHLSEFLIHAFNKLAKFVLHFFTNFFCLFQIKIWFQNRRTKWKRKYTNDLEQVISQQQ